MKEFSALLSEAAKFKKLLTEANPDIGLVQSYQQEVTKKSWVETLPGKAIRFVVATGAGFAASAAGGPAGGLGVGATNTFLLDRLLKGWRPNRFIEGPYKRFVFGSGEQRLVFLAAAVSPRHRRQNRPCSMSWRRCRSGSQVNTSIKEAEK